MRWRYRRHRVALIAGAAALLLLMVPAWIASWLRPKLLEHSTNAVQYAATSAMNQAVQDTIAGLDAPLVSLTTKEGGTVAALTTDTAAVDAIKTAVVQAVYDSIGALETKKLSVPIGTLIDPQFMAGVGFSVPFGVTGLGVVHAECHSEFSEAGINQTRHVLTLTVSADVGIQTIGCVKNVTVTADYPIADTVLVGEVPLVLAENQ